MKFTEFLTSKSITTEQLKEKSAEELAGLYNEYNETKSAAIEKAIELKASKEDIDSLKEELHNGQLEQMKSLNATLTAMGVQIKKLSTKEKEERANDVNTISKGLNDNIDSLKALKSREDKNSNVSFKAAGTMLISSNVSGGNVPVEQRLSGLDNIPTRAVRLLDVVSRGSADSNIISWVSKVNKDGAAGGTAEGALKNQIDFDLVVDSESVKKRTAFIKVSNEMIDDIPFMETEINNELMTELLLDVENQVYQGDNIGTNLNGIKTQSSAFVAGTFAGTVDNANAVDVLTVATGQIEEADQPTPTYAFVHPRTITELKLIKASSTDKRYVDRLMMVAGQMTLDGMPIIKTTLVTVGEYLIGHFPNATVYDKGSIAINMGFENDDFTKNLVTILAEWRGLNLIKTNKRPSFIAGVFATDAAALETA